VGDEVLARLATHYAKLDVWLELGLQSANDRTLGRIGRGHDAAAFADAVRRAHAQGIMVAAHVILGLPDEDEADEARTADFLAALGVEGVKIHQLAVVAGTPLEEEYRAGMFKVLDEADYVRRAAAFVKRLPTTTVLHRLVGDTLGGRLVAPRFEKARVVRAIRERLST
jgi:radical SAM protein (TIGR01212 family)